MYVKVNVYLICDENVTPWCIKPITCVPGYYMHEKGTCVDCTYKKYVIQKFRYLTAAQSSNRCGLVGVLCNWVQEW